jgi:glutamate N-acetyltransferase/amino-acid N-acetyltransferase
MRWSHIFAAVISDPGSPEAKKLEAALTALLQVSPQSAGLAWALPGPHPCSTTPRPAHLVPRPPQDPALSTRRRLSMSQGLAKSIAWDGEGATVLIECEVLGAPDDTAANKVAKSVVGSSLAKSAIFGHDPNWGRIAAAAG